MPPIQRARETVLAQADIEHPVPANPDIHDRLAHTLEVRICQSVQWHT